MADHTQLNSGDATLRDTIHNEPLALDPELVADVLNPGLFVDVNDQEAEYQRLYAGQPETAFIPNGLEIPRPNLPALFDGASTSAISTEALRTPEPEHNEDNLRAGDAHDQNATHNRYRDVNFEEFINFAACEPADTVETEPPMPNPTILHQYHSEPTVSMTVKPLPFTRSSTSAGALLESPTEPHDGLHRSISKRGRQDTSNDPASPIKKPIGKRLKKQKDGYPCKGCTEIFDRDCDRTKHFERNHKPKDQHPYACPHCKANGIVKAFQYPKDLRRHFKQVHNIVTPSVSPDRKLPNTSPVSETASKPSVLRALSNAVMSLKKLRITATSPQHNLIMVSKDQKSFFEVEVSGLNFAADLVSRILDTLGLDKNFPLQGVQAQAYSREYGRVKLGQKLDAQNIFKLVNKNADGQGSLKLLISTADGYHT